MFRNYFNIAFRLLLRQKVFSLINILGLSVGIAACVLIVLFVDDELSYDRYHRNADLIYRVVTLSESNGRKLETPKTPASLGLFMVKEIPEVDVMTRLIQGSNKLVSHGDTSFTEKQFYYADSTFFDVFSFKILRADTLPLLNKPNTVVLTKSTATRYFGTDDPVGKILNLDNGLDYRVTGICEDVAPNSHFHFDFVASLLTYPMVFSMEDQWLIQSNYTYFKAKPGSNPDSLVSGLNRIIDQYLAPNIFDLFGVTLQDWFAENQSYQYYIQPLTSIHLNSKLSNELETNGDLASVYIFSIIALFLLLIACINFMNLSTAHYARRAKEVGIRKVLGSERRQLIQQYLIESLVLSFFALVLGLALVEIVLPEFNHFTGKMLSLELFDSWIKIPLLILLGIVVGLMAGSYPAFFLSSLQAGSIFRGSYRRGSRSKGLRNALVLSQFSISIILFIGTFTILQQLGYIRQKELGFDKEDVVILQRAYALKGNYTEFKTALLAGEGIVSASASSGYPGQKEYLGFSFRIADSAQAHFFPMKVIPCDGDFLKTMRISLKEGRMFDTNVASDSLSIVITESAAKDLGLQEALGTVLEVPSEKGAGHNYKLPVVGVVKDLHSESLREEIKPVVFTPVMPHEHIFYFAIRLDPENKQAGLEHIRNVWQDFVQDQPFEYFFLDDMIEELYQDDTRIGTLGTFFSLLAILIACLGLLGLASFTAEQRTREIGIRRVMGASVSGIIFTLSFDFLRWIILANLIAWPVAWYVMGIWLNQFEYHISMDPLVFIAASVLALVIAILTVTYESYKAATANPVEALKYE